MADVDGTRLVNSGESQLEVYTVSATHDDFSQRAGIAALST